MEPRILDQVELSSKGGCCPVDEGAASGGVAIHQDVAGLGKSSYSTLPLPRSFLLWGPVTVRKSPHPAHSVGNLTSLKWKIGFAWLGGCYSLGIFLCR